MRSTILRSRALWLVALVGLLLWMAASAVLGEGALRPARVRPEITPGLRQQLTRLSTSWESPTVTSFDGTTLKAWFIRPAGGSARCAILLHGIADSRRGAAGPAPFLLEAGYAVLLPDIRAHGESGGDLLTYGYLERRDLTVWAAWLKEHGCTRLYGLGESLGAAVLIQAAARSHDFSALVAECSFSSLRQVAIERVREKTPAGAEFLVPGALLYARLRYGYNLFHVSPEEDVAQLSAPLLLIHGLTDERTPYHHSQRIFAAARHQSVELWLVPGAGHTGAFSAAPQEFRRKVLALFSAN